VNVRFWGTRGSLASAGPETARYGGNTACVEVRRSDGGVIVLDAGSGIRGLGLQLGSAKRIDILLTHLHMDHIQGLGFFTPLFGPGCTVHLWGPPSASADLRSRLGRYLSPPLFPVRVRDLRSVVYHDAPVSPTRIGSATVVARPIIHPGLTVGYRIEESGRALAYMPDHEPALGARRFPESPRWTSGHTVAEGADVLIHDAQYTEIEYRSRVGYGHSTLGHALAFAGQARARTLVPFHHDPAHDDDQLDAIFAGAEPSDGLMVVAAREGLEIPV
jgi:phosphoribosyl 1,2-cyclic phosphodiesterase